MRLFMIACAACALKDIVQEVYVRAFTNLAGFRGDSAFATWLSRIAINDALSRMRKRRGRIDVDLDALDDPSSVNRMANVVIFPAPDAEAARGEVRAAIERAVDRLPPSYRVVFVLREIEGLSTAETAAMLAIRPETVKTRLFRGRALMRRALEQEFQTGFSGLFPFGGRRCRDMADRVIARLRSRS